MSGNPKVFTKFKSNQPKSHNLVPTEVISKSNLVYERIFCILTRACACENVGRGALLLYDTHDTHTNVNLFCTAH